MVAPVRPVSYELLCPGLLGCCVCLHTQPGAVDVFLDFISYSGGPLPEQLLEKVRQQEVMHQQAELCGLLEGLLCWPCVVMRAQHVVHDRWTTKSLADRLSLLVLLLTSCCC